MHRETAKGWTINAVVLTCYCQSRSLSLRWYLSIIVINILSSTTTFFTQLEVLLIVPLHGCTMPPVIKVNVAISFIIQTDKLSVLEGWPTAVEMVYVDRLNCYILDCCIEHSIEQIRLETKEKSILLFLTNTCLFIL